MRKIHFIILLFASLLFFSCGGKQVEISNGDIKFSVNDKMHVKIASLNPQTEAFYNGFVPADYLVTREFTAKDFSLKGVTTSTDKDGNQVYNLTGLYNKDGFKIEKHVEIVVPDNFSGMLLFNIQYVNMGDKEATVTAWANHQLRMKQTDTEMPIWSLQASSSNRRDDWILPVTNGFYQKNYLGMNNSDYGGGIPVVDLWRKDGGFAAGLTENTLKLVSLPVEMGRYNDYATAGIVYEYDEPINFGKDDVIETYKSFVSVHTGDFFDPLKQFSHYMQSQGIQFAEPEEEAYEAVWCAWGYERMFTIDEVINTLPKVKELGFRWVDVDDGFQICEGDWETNERFPGGDKDMRRIADAIHKHGMKAKLWWAPLAADPCSNILKKKPDMQLLTEEWAPEFITWWDSYYLSPVNPQTKKYTEELVKRFLKTWDFDGLKMDGQHLNCCQPDHNPASKLDYPEQAVELLPTFFEDIYNTAREIKPYAVIQNCPCGTAMNFFNMPYMNQAVSSDPTSSWQIRLKGKVYRAIFDEIAYYADHVELSDNGDDFPTQIGIGAVVGSKFTYPKDNPHVKQSYLLTPEKEKLYKKWVGIYNDKMLSKGDYLNLYDLTFDNPETHAISKDGKMYYAFYADQWDGKIELRGLEKGREYTVCEYATDDMKTYTISGDSPYIEPEFTRNYLIEVY
ncbi:alpha-galactosidase [Paludibacter sp. 221]|uniref:glycoside hydrolase family 36 protein n=1 Tax=Paludibacter sp. 221 TaxID=2302939 RepID=UPI0013D73F55|nr:glycoside hydrolase family 36 protein [Paludibacter sp. 221]NDV46081.1 alpha-galactosidase [Paludibacter sp. 221]